MRIKTKSVTKIIILLVLMALSIFVEILIIQLITKDGLKETIKTILSSSSDSEIVMIITLVVFTTTEVLIAFLTIVEDRKIIIKQQERQKKYIQYIKLLEGKRLIDENKLLNLRQKEVLTQKEMEDIKVLLNTSQSSEIDDINSAIDRINYYALCRIENSASQLNDESA